MTKTEERIWQLAYLAAIVLASWLFGLHGWATLIAIVIAVIAVLVLNFAFAFTRVMIRDTWPAVPPELAPKVVSLRAGGWSTGRVHRWWACDEKRPHVHMIREGVFPLVLIWDGTTVLDQYGNVIRHEI